MAKFYTLKVINVARLTSHSVVISFAIPDALADAFSFQAGQYVTLKTIIAGTEIRRSYSLCSAPNKSVLKVGIKQIENGVFSTYANQSLKVGDSIEVSTPEGRFIYTEKEYNTPVMSVVAGSGITPIMSILEKALRHENPQPFVLVYGNKSPEKTMFYETLKNLEKQYASILKIHWLYSAASHEPNNNQRINETTLATALEASSILPTKFYLCGPEALIELTKDFLLRRGIHQENIAYELFTSSAKATDVETSIQSGKLELTCDGVLHRLELQSGKTLLDIALQAKIDVPYSCQGGVCSSCIAKVTQGHANMLSNQILTDSEVADGLVLTCQAVAQSSNIAVDYDDV